LTITCIQPQTISLTETVEILKKYCSAIKLKRNDETPAATEFSFFVEFDTIENMELAKASIKSVQPGAAITFMDNTRDL
jgi:hypothetical protein